MLKQRHQLFVTLFGITDSAAAIIACAAAWVWRRERYGQHAEFVGNYLVESLTVLLVPMLGAVLYSMGMYRPRRDRALIGEMWGVLKSSWVALALIVILVWVSGVHETKAFQFEGPQVQSEFLTGAFRFQILTIGVILPCLLGVQRLIVRLGLRAMRRRGLNTRHVAVIGVGRLGQIAARTLERNAWTGIRVSYFISHHDQTSRTKCMKKPIRGGVRELEAILEAHPVDAVYLAIPAAMSAQLSQILQRLERYAIDVRCIPDVRLRYLPQSMAVSTLEGMPILSYRESPLAGFGGVAKRAIDIVGAMVGLIVFSPVMVLIAIVIRMTSPGPVIFRQKRVSFAGGTFQIYKFRTMSDSGSEGDYSWTQENDPRVTRFGKWLRQTSLDEIPQLLNVLLGQMSLVGPRPERPELIDQFREDWKGYMIRQHVKAGMTGWAQVNGLRGNTSLRKRLQYDLFYIRNWSVVFDLRILVLTIFRGFVHKNAY